MLGILFVAFVALEGIRAETYDDFKPITYYIKQIKRNQYVTEKTTGRDKNIKQSLWILQEITEDAELKVSIQYRDSWDHDKVLQDVDFQDLCSALDKWADNKNTSSGPQPDEMLGLKGKRCPLKSGSIQLPKYTLPTTMNLDFPVKCDGYLSYVVYIEDEDSTKDRHRPYMEIRAISQRSCKQR